MMSTCFKNIVFFYFHLFALEVVPSVGHQGSVGASVEIVVSSVVVVDWTVTSSEQEILTNCWTMTFALLFPLFPLLPLPFAKPFKTSLSNDFNKFDQKNKNKSYIIPLRIPWSLILSKGSISIDLSELNFKSSKIFSISFNSFLSKFKLREFTIKRMEENVKITLSMIMYLNFD